MTIIYKYDDNNDDDDNNITIIIYDIDMIKLITF